MTIELQSSVKAEAGPQFTARDKWLTKKEVAALVQMSGRWIEKMMHKGLVFHKFGRSTRYRLEDVERFLNENTRVCRPKD